VARRTAGELLGAAYADANDLGMSGLVGRAKGLMSEFEIVPTLTEASPAAPPAESSREAAADELVSVADNLFRRDDDYWTLVFEGRTCRLKDAKGLRYIALLIHEPNRQFHVAELARADRGPAGAPDLPEPSHDYRDRLRDLCAELEEAERCNESGAAARAQAAIDELTGELTRALGLDGPSRVPASELLRLRVTKAIKAAARKIGTQHPALGHHLRTTIRTGSFCSYSPDPTKPIRWN
jgi:non-specific serine/threonine protein kinase